MSLPRTCAFQRTRSSRQQHPQRSPPSHRARPHHLRIDATMPNDPGIRLLCGTRHACLADGDHRGLGQTHHRRSRVFRRRHTALFSRKIVPFEMETTDIDGQHRRRASVARPSPPVFRNSTAGVLRGDLEAASIRIFSVPGNSRRRPLPAPSITRSSTAPPSSREKVPRNTESSCVLCSVPPPVWEYSTPVQIQADGEVLGHSTAIIETTDATVTSSNPGKAQHLPKSGALPLAPRRSPSPGML